jgi:hypothetical protein
MAYRSSPFFATRSAKEMRQLKWRSPPTTSAPRSLDQPPYDDRSTAEGRTGQQRNPRRTTASSDGSSTRPWCPRSCHVRSGRLSSLGRSGPFGAWTFTLTSPASRARSASTRSLFGSGRTSDSLHRWTSRSSARCGTSKPSPPGGKSGSCQGCAEGAERGASASSRGSRGFSSTTAPSIQRRFTGMKLTVSAGGR